MTAHKPYFVKAVQVPKDAVQRRVADMLEQKKEKLVIIKADEDVEYGAVMEAMDNLRAAGIEDMGLITETRRNANALSRGGE